MITTVRSRRRLAAVAVAGAAAVAAIAGPNPATAYPRPGRTTQVDDQGKKAPAGEALYSSISSNGRFIAFDTAAPLLSADNNTRSDVYVRDVATGKLTLASVGLDGKAGAELATVTVCQVGQGAWANRSPLSWDPAISGNGRYVAFTSVAATLVPGDLNLAPDVFVYDSKTSKVTRISVASNGDEAEVDGLPGGTGVCPGSFSPSINGTGRRVTFTSYAENLAANDVLQADVFVHDRTTRRTTLVSAPRADVTGSSCVVEVAVLQMLCVGTDSDFSAISADGRFVTFSSLASNLVAGDTNHAADVFVRDLARGKTERVSVASDGRQVGEGYGELALPTTAANDTGKTIARPQHSISAHGRYVVFRSSARGLAPNDTKHSDIFVRDRLQRTTERVSVLSTGEQFVDVEELQSASISSDGRFVAFAGLLYGGNHPANWPWGQWALTYDRATGALEVTSRADDGSFGDGCKTGKTTFTEVDRVDISGNSRFLSYSTCDRNLQDHPDKDRHRTHIVRTERGQPLGTGSSLVPKVGVAGRASFVSTGIAATADRLGDVDEFNGAGDVRGMRVAYRPNRHDLYFKVEVKRLQRLQPDLPLAGVTAHAVPTLYGVRFTVDGARYELRADATSLLLGDDARFTLARCEGNGLTTCTAVAQVRGGYGTTGEAVVFAVPLRDIGLGRGGVLRAVEAYSAVGTATSGATAIVDTVVLS